MKITDMRLENYRWPKQAAQSNGKHTYTHEGRNFVFIDTDEGITGVGQIGGTHTADSINKAIFDYYKEFVIGKDLKAHRFTLAARRLKHLGLTMGVFGDQSVGSG